MGGNPWGVVYLGILTEGNLSKVNSPDINANGHKIY